MKIDVYGGFVMLLDALGSDAAIARAARVSYGAGTRSPSDDRTLIRYLMRHRHTTPFEMCEFIFGVRVPMDCWRQWIRHRTASVNEVSSRYSVVPDAMATTVEWRAQSTTNNKQGSDGLVKKWPDEAGLRQHAWQRYGVTEPGQYLSEREKELQRHAREVYEERLQFGVAREQARKDLPLSTYTEAYWKMDFHNLLHFLELRLHPHAQQEIREYAKAILQLIEPIVPVAVEAFRDYRLNAITLTAADIEAIRMLNSGVGGVELDTVFAHKREQAECIQTLQRLGWMK